MATRPYAERVGLQVELADELERELTVKADARRIGQVLTNLLANAVKFTPPGGRIQAGAARASNGWVEFWVADTGVGIPRDQLVRVFERFYKTDLSRTGAGTGLGLAICKHLVQAHGGSIWADSRAVTVKGTFLQNRDYLDLFYRERCTRSWKWKPDRTSRRCTRRRTSAVTRSPRRSTSGICRSTSA